MPKPLTPDELMRLPPQPCDGCGRTITPADSKIIDWKFYCSTQCWQKNGGQDARKE